MLICSLPNHHEAWIPLLRCKDIRLRHIVMSTTGSRAFMYAAKLSVVFIIMRVRAGDRSRNGLGDGRMTRQDLLKDHDEEFMGKFVGK